MIAIGVISDTHGYLDPKIAKYFENCNEIWHAGDIGNIAILKELGEIAMVRAVYGNIDNVHLRYLLPEHEQFEINGLKVWMTHIGGYPGKYSSKVKHTIFKKPPDIFISGHSHILKVLHDKKLGLLHINPGAAGRQGFHKKKTIVRLQITTKIENLEVIEWH